MAQQLPRSSGPVQCLVAVAPAEHQITVMGGVWLGTISPRAMPSWRRHGQTGALGLASAPHRLAIMAMGGVAASWVFSGGVIWAGFVEGRGRGPKFGGISKGRPEWGVPFDRDQRPSGLTATSAAM